MPKFLGWDLDQWLIAGMTVISKTLAQRAKITRKSPINLALKEEPVYTAFQGWVETLKETYRNQYCSGDFALDDYLGSISDSGLLGIRNTILTNDPSTSAKQFRERIYPDSTKTTFTTAYGVKKDGTLPYKKWKGDMLREQIEELLKIWGQENVVCYHIFEKESYATGYFKDTCWSKTTAAEIFERYTENIDKPTTYDKRSFESIADCEGNEPSGHADGEIIICSSHTERVYYYTFLCGAFTHFRRVIA